jgi:hypothetical protein
MQASDTQDASKAALYTSLKCGIPVAVLAGIALFCFCMPEDALKAFGFVWGYVAQGGILAVIGLAEVLQAFSHIIYPVLTVVIIGYLWCACAINNLKSKGLTGSLYEKLMKVFSILCSTLLVTMALWICIVFSQLRSVPAMESVIKLWSWLGVCMILMIVLGYTSTKNNGIIIGIKK